MKIREQYVREVFLETTNLCGADCIICPHKTMKRKKGIMTKELSNKITDEAVELNVGELTFNGFGEAFLDPYIFDRVEYAKTRGIKSTCLFSNGMHLKPKETAKSGFDMIYFSLDAATAKTHKIIRPGLDYSKVESNIIELLSYKKRPLVKVAFVENEHNRHEIKMFNEKWKKADEVHIVPNHGWAGEMNCSKPKKREPCYLLWAGIFVSYTGEVMLCCLDYEVKGIKYDLNKHTLRGFWEGKLLKGIREEHKQRIFKGLCKNCIHNAKERGSWWA